MEIDPIFWKDRKILLTGHTGFKGSWLSLWLQQLGSNVIGYSKSVPTQPSLYEVANVEEGMISILGDVCDLEHIEEVLRAYRPEIVIHMAAQSLVRTSYENPLETYATNVMGTVNLLEAVRRMGSVRVVVNVTSDKCYENKELNRGYKEDDPMGGYDPYSSSKGCAELITSSFRNSYFNADNYDKHGIALASVRAGNVIGGGDWAKDRLIPDIIQGIINNKKVIIRRPNAIRPWQFVLDPLNGYLLLIEKLWSDGKHFVGGWNFGPTNDESKQVNWLINRLTQNWKNVQIIFENEDFHETNILKLDSKKAQLNLGWKTKMNLELTMDWIVEWYRSYEQKCDMRKITQKQINDFMML